MKDVRTMNFTALKKLIIAVPDRLGDTLFCTPLLRLLKTNNKDLIIDIIAPTKLAATTLHHNHYINTIYCNPTLIELETIENNYDLAIDISDSVSATAAIQHIKAELISPHRKIATSEHTTENLLRFFAKFFNLSLHAFSQEYELHPQTADYNAVKKIFANHHINLKQDILIGFHLGCHSLAGKRTRLWNKFRHGKAWPLKKFIKLATKLQQHNKDIRIIVTGTKNEQKLTRKFLKKVPTALNLVNKTTIHELAALINHCQIFVSNDTGVMHIACTTTATVIALFGVSNPNATGPYPPSPKHITITKPNIADISVDSILHTVENHVNISSLCS